MKFIQLDPEWTVAVKCPEYGCKAIMFACCRDHAEEQAVEHRAESHAGAAETTTEWAYRRKTDGADISTKKPYRERPRDQDHFTTISRLCGPWVEHATVEREGGNRG